jgi:hypothetical protein
MKNKVRFSSLAIIVVLLVLVPAGLGRFTEVAPEAYAQRSSSCDRAVVSLVDCSRSTSSSHSSDDSSAADDDDEKNNKDDNSDKGNNNDKDQKEDENGGDIESKIPSTAGGGVPFP